MKYRVSFSPEAEEDLERIFNHAFERELNSSTGDLDLSDTAIDAIEQACRFLEIGPFSCRKVGESGLVRELVNSFGTSGFVAMFEIQDAQTVVTGAIRHQRESDYH